MNNLLSNIALCRRAGFLVSGFDAVLKETNAVNSKIAGILVTSDISDKTLKELRFKSKNDTIIKIPVTMEDIKTVLGKRTAVIAISDDGLYKALQKSLYV